MAFVIWNPAWETGIAVIDEQHRKLLAQMEALLLAIHENHPDDQIPEILAFLAGYVDTHFSHEERHMQASSYPGFTGHKAIHDEMRARVAQLVAGYRSNPGVMTESVVDFLTEWLVDHINEHDRRMAAHLHWFEARGTGVEP